MLCLYYLFQALLLLLLSLLPPLMKRFKKMFLYQNIHEEMFAKKGGKINGVSTAL